MSDYLWGIVHNVPTQLVYFFVSSWSELDAGSSVVQVLVSSRPRMCKEMHVTLPYSG